QNARPVQNGARPTQNARPPKKKMRFHPNKDGIMAIIVLLLIVAIAITVVVCVVKGITNAINSSKTDDTTVTTATTETSSTTEASTVLTDIITTAPVVGAWNEGYELLNFANTKVHEGDLVLVNHNYEYTFPSTMEKKIASLWGLEGYNTAYVLGNDTRLNTSIVHNIAQMLTAMKAANIATLSNGYNLQVASGYRTYSYQNELYNKAVANGTEGYSAIAGHSEHHTGLAFDIKVFYKAPDGKTATYDLRAAEQDWILANCANYGFILRYPAEKVDITKILEESWHFRYVGVPHAKYITDNAICLEEYIDLLREKHTYGTSEPLSITANAKEYLVYFVPASVENDVTAVTVPSSGNYTVSGNNADGFIVTVEK
ncbi:MAG: M15 family metallopeptidase, partial [Clostridia bacterium]|nr:M15 family metallopeptidase [Clostridia bacterium]